MKTFTRSALLVLLVCFVGSLLNAQVTLSGTTGPTFSSSNTYFPTFRYPTVTATGTGTGTINVSGSATAIFKVAGAYSALVMPIQVSNDGVTWTTVNANPIGTTTTAVASVTFANTPSGGVFAVSTAGMTSLRFNITTLTLTSGSLVITTTGSALVYTTR